MRTIEDVFTDAGIVPVPAEEIPQEQGVRRSTAHQYLQSLNVDGPRDCRKLLPVL